MKRFITAVLLFIAVKGFAQTGSSVSPLTPGNCMETYCTYYFGNPLHHNHPAFVYTHNTYSKAILNAGCIKAVYQKENTRPLKKLGL